MGILPEPPFNFRQIYDLQPKSGDSCLKSPFNLWPDSLFQFRTVCVDPAALTCPTVAPSIPPAICAATFFHTILCSSGRLKSVLEP